MLLKIRKKDFFYFCCPSTTACNCDVMGSSSLVCDVITGQCPCRVNVATNSQRNALGQINDLRCHSCLADYYGLSTGQGCRPCDCNVEGRNSSSQCTDAGVCTCKPNVAGNQCNRCASGYYSFSSTGCL